MRFHNADWIFFTVCITVIFGALATMINSPTIAGSRTRLPIDSHLHVWSDGLPPFTFEQQEPPTDLQHCQVEHLIVQQREAGVGGALIVQPINHGYDHSYVVSVMQRFKNMKGMCLMNPALDKASGMAFLDDRKQEGFVGVRFNPYLWPNGESESMSSARGSAWYAHCGELGLPVGFMCFKGLSLHYEDINTLLTAFPRTRAVIDHWGFFRQGDVDDEASWQQLLSLAAFPQVYVKVSALFRVSSSGEWPYIELDGRLQQLLRSFGARRLLWGSDYPFVQQHCGYACSLSALARWEGAAQALSLEEWDWIYRGTAESLFGSWPDEFL